MGGAHERGDGVGTQVYVAMLGIYTTRQVFFHFILKHFAVAKTFFVLSRSIYNLQNLVKLIPECKNHGYDSSVICYL